MKSNSINFYLSPACNYHCRFCYSRHLGQGAEPLTLPKIYTLLSAFRRAGCQKVTFGGGEPTLHPDIEVIIRHTKMLGMTTSLVTNGTRLENLLLTSPDIDWVALSGESCCEETEKALGRGTGGHVAQTIHLAKVARFLGARVKLCSVVTSLNCEEDLTPLVKEVQPDRWKIFQMLPIPGENDDGADLCISQEQFQRFLDAHRHLSNITTLVPEDNDAMLDSYLLVDPAGRFFSSGSDRHVVSDPILEVGMEKALQQVRFDYEKFLARGGGYQ